MKKTSFYLASICALFFIICNTSLANAPTKKPITLTPDQLADNTNNFAFKLFNKTYASENNENIAISPYSIATVLTMAYNGAAKNTEKTMATMLGINGIDLNTINQTYLLLENQLQSLGSQTQLLIANSLWISKEIKLNPNFIARTKKYFDAQVNAVDFSSTNTATSINDWVKEHTQNKITKLADSFDKDNRLVLINAIYFKGKWQKQFNLKDTKTKKFTSLNGERKYVPTMRQDGHYHYLENDTFQAITLPFGDDYRINMFFFLPKPNISINDFIAQLTLENWKNWCSGFYFRDGHVELPRFKVEYSAFLKNDLGQLGMENAFNATQANFSGITTTQKLFITEVLHKIVVEVTEKGAEAAAITAVCMPGSARGGSEPPPPFEFIANRPFFYAIVDQKTGSILFMGVIKYV